MHAKRRLAPPLLAAALFSVARHAMAAPLDELSVGGYAHSFNNSNGRKESGTGEVEIELDTARPGALRFLGSPRLAFTAAFNTAGKTNFGGVALDWDRHLFGRLYGALQFGLDLNDGVVRGPRRNEIPTDRSDRLWFGSKVLFREAAALSWRLDRRWEVGLRYIHNSNGEILSHGPNESINEVGVRIGRRFG